MEFFLSGFLLGLSLILAIGPQNAFILKAGLVKRFVPLLCLLCAASDAILIIAGVFGFGVIFETFPIEGPFGAKVPLPKNFFTPELLIVPLVAFDRKGGRVGYGGGFYDRTLEKLKMDKPVLAVGFAYSCQEIERVPLEKTDQRLDFVVTEKDVWHSTHS